MNNTKGRFIVFEGIDGSGKSTQISLLKEKLASHNIPCLETQEPSGGPVGSLLRQFLSGRMKADERVLAELFAADRLDHLLNETDGLCPKIDQGISVISDRYVLSNYAYQSVSIPLEWIMQLNSQANNIVKPDCHLFIDVDPDVCMKRMEKGRFHKDLYETKERLTQVRNQYLDLIQRLKEEEHIEIINGNQSIQCIADEIWSKVCHYFV